MSQLRWITAETQLVTQLWEDECDSSIVTEYKALEPYLFDQSVQTGQWESCTD